MSDSIVQEIPYLKIGIEFDKVLEGTKNFFELEIDELIPKSEVMTIIELLKLYCTRIEEQLISDASNICWVDEETQTIKWVASPISGNSYAHYSNRRVMDHDSCRILSDDNIEYDIKTGFYSLEMYFDPNLSPDVLVKYYKQAFTKIKSEFENVIDKLSAYLPPKLSLPIAEVNLNAPEADRHYSVTVDDKTYPI